MSYHANRLSTWCESHEDQFDVSFYSAYCLILYITGKLPGITAFVVAVLIFALILVGSRFRTLSERYVSDVEEGSGSLYLYKYLHRMTRKKKENALQSVCAGVVYIVYVCSVVAMHRFGGPLADSIVYRLTVELLLLIVIYKFLLTAVGLFVSSLHFLKIGNATGR